MVRGDLPTTAKISGDSWFIWHVGRCTDHAIHVRSTAGFGVSLNARRPAMCVVLLSSVLQTIGFALPASVPVSTSIPARVYGFQVIAGFGCGINISTLLLLVPLVIDYRDKGNFMISQ